MAIGAATAGNGGRTLVLSRRVKRAVAVLAVGGLIAILAFLAGEPQRQPFIVLHGTATVGDHEATVIVAGWAYGIEGTSVPWVDQEGMTHYGSWPACLGGAGRTVSITFGEIPVTTPGGETSRQVVWVDCRS